MGLPEEEFWRLTPRQFDVLSRRAMAQREREDRHIARICATIANSAPRDKKKRKIFTEDDFMPKQSTAKIPRKKQTPHQMFKIVEMLNAAYGGTIKEGPG